MASFQHLVTFWFSTVPDKADTVLFNLYEKTFHAFITCRLYYLNDQKRIWSRENASKQYKIKKNFFFLLISIQKIKSNKVPSN